MPSATKCAHSAAIEAPQASSTRRRFLLAMTAPRAETAWLGVFIFEHCAQARARKSTPAQARYHRAHVFTSGWEESPWPSSRFPRATTASTRTSRSTRSEEHTSELQSHHD